MATVTSTYLTMQRTRSTGEEAQEKLKGFKIARDVASRHFNIQINSILRSRRRACIEVKRMLIYFTRKELMFTEVEAGHVFQTDRSTINYHAKTHSDLIQVDHDYHLEYEAFRIKAIEKLEKENVSTV